MIIGICMLMFMHSMTSWLEDHQSLGLIDDGKVHDRIVWIPMEMRSKFYGKIYFDAIPYQDKSKFIEAMNTDDYGTMKMIFDKYRR